jgi:MFS family permease
MSTEIFLMSYLSECLAQDWGIGNFKETSLSSIIFAGQIFGAILWGTVGDTYGRKKSLASALALVVVSGFVTIFSINFSMLCCMRFLVGLGTGGLYLPINYLAEVLPASYRGIGVSIVGFFWAIGNVYVAGFAWILLPSHSADGWRSLSLICMIPSAIALIMCMFFPESPRWLLSAGREAEAIAEVKNMATRSNKPNIGEFTLELPPTQDKDASLLDLLSTKFISLNLRVWTIWFCIGFCYYGIVLFISRIFVENDKDDDGDVDNAEKNRCSFKFLSMFISSLAEVPAALMPMFMLGVFARNTLQALYCSLAAVSCILLGAVPGITGKTLFAFCGRALLRSAFNVAIIAVTELYPTHIRSFSGAVAVFISRVGAFLSPYLVQNESIGIMNVCIVLTVMSGVMGATAFITPDTKEIKLDDRVNMDLVPDMNERLSSFAIEMDHVTAFGEATISEDVVNPVSARKAADNDL